MRGNTTENREGAGTGAWTLRSAGTTPCAVSSPICVTVAAHKPYRMPDDPMYLPLHVGAALHPNVVVAANAVGDDTGENISRLNDSYSELTGLYWLWKNTDEPFVGLVHYRRHFGTRSLVRQHGASDRFARIVGHEELGVLLEDHDIVLPKKRNYYIETIYSHYAHTFPGEQLQAVHAVLQRDFPEYLPAFAAVMKSTTAHMFNMFVMSRERLDEYCSWLFPVLEELTALIAPDKYGDAFQARYPGRISEMLLDVWLITNGYDSPEHCTELPVVSPEPINWMKKGSSFLLAKAGLKKYSKSF